jgi:hypothetical protein
MKKGRENWQENPSATRVFGRMFLAFFRLVSEVRILYSGGTAVNTVCC